MPITARPGPDPLADDDPRHETTGGYDNHGCRCPRCKAANRERNRQRWANRPNPLHQGPPDDHLLVSCWCERGLCWVPTADVRAGLTGVCGRKGC